MTDKTVTIRETLVKDFVRLHNEGYHCITAKDCGGDMQILGKSTAPRMDYYQDVVIFLGGKIYVEKVYDPIIGRYKEILVDLGIILTYSEFDLEKLQEYHSALRLRLFPNEED